MLLMIDNYDSFTYNLVQAFLVCGAEVDVQLNPPSVMSTSTRRSIAWPLSAVYPETIASYTGEPSSSLLCGVWLTRYW